MPSAMSDGSGTCACAVDAISTPVTSRSLTAARSKLVQLRRIVDQDSLADPRVGRPRRQQVQYIAVVDPEERRQLARLAPGARIRMRPVRSPENALGGARDQRFGRRTEGGPGRA